MKVSEFKDVLDNLKSTSSRNGKKEIIRSVKDSPAAISLLSGSEYDDAGLGKKTVLSVAQDVFGEYIDGTPTVSESLTREDSGHGANTLDGLHTDMEELARLSGNDMKAYLGQMFEQYDYPSVVAHACLDDWPTGVSDTTIANALDLRDALPFYDSVVDASEVPSPITEPMVHNAFDPQLAVPESRGRPEGNEIAAQMKLDGYRCIIHVTPDRVRAFSRRRNDITESLPELQEIDWPDVEFIIDAEVLSETGSYSDTSERVGRSAENVERDVEMQFGAFDLVTYNGRRTFNKPYKERYGKLLYLEQMTSDERFKVLGLERDVERAKDLAAENGDEGIIVKDLTAPYKFGKRDSSWQKVKLDDETVDVRITGFKEGKGRLDGTLGKVAIESEDAIDLGYSGSGFNDEQRDEIWNNKDEWQGATIEVEARGLGTGDKLRMPIYKRDRRDDGEPDSFEKIEQVMKTI